MPASAMRQYSLGELSPDDVGAPDRILAEIFGIWYVYDA